MPARLLSATAFPWLILFVCTLYAVTRYNVFGDVAIEQVPTYVMNKATSFAGLAILAASRMVADGDSRRRLGLFGAACILIHVPLSLAIMQPAYFAAFYNKAGLLTWQAEASMLAGSVALVPLVWLFAATDLAGHPSQRRPFVVPPGLGRLLLTLSAPHVGLIGYGKWTQPEKWPGWLPPITLLSAPSWAVSGHESAAFETSRGLDFAEECLPKLKRRVSEERITKTRKERKHEEVRATDGTRIKHGWKRGMQLGFSLFLIRVVPWLRNSFSPTAKRN